MAHTSSGVNIETAVVADASSKDTSMIPLAIAKPPSAGPGLPPELLDLIIQHLIDAQSLRRLALASRLFASLTRRYRFRVLILSGSVDCFQYWTFCQTTAPDAPSFVRELHFNGLCLLNEQFPCSKKIVPLAITDVRSLSLENNAWGNLLVAGIICTAYIHTLTLCQETFTDMAETEAVFREMPSLKTVILKDQIRIQRGFGAPSGIDEAPEIWELVLVDVYNSGELMDHVIAYATPFSLRKLKRLHIHHITRDLENFLSKVIQSPGDMEELVITRPIPSFGHLGEDPREEELSDEVEESDEEEDDEINMELTGHALSNGSSAAAGNAVSTQQVISSLPVQSTSLPGLRLHLLQFDLISGDDNIYDENGYALDDTQQDPAPTRPLRWLTSCFSQSHSSLLVGIIKINISADDGDVLDFVNDTLWREWDAQLAKFDGDPPEVQIDIKSVVCEWEVEDKGEEEVPTIVAIREEALQDLRQCIERNMVHVREARGLRISSAVCVQDGSE